MDLRRFFAHYSGTSSSWILRAYLGSPQYRALLTYRLTGSARNRILRHIAFRLYRHYSLKSGVELSGSIGGGLIMPHWGRIILDARSVGHNLYVLHNVTVGDDFRTGRPAIGNNVFIGTGSVIVGKITVGDNVIVGAQSFVNASVPPSSLVAGNPARVIRAIDPSEVERITSYPLVSGPVARKDPPP